MHHTISAARARQLLLRHLALDRPWHQAGAQGTRSLLRHLRCIQLDPLAPMGDNADMVVMERVDGVPRGQVHQHAHPGAFEHFAKQRCLLPQEAYPYYRARAAQKPDWLLNERLKRVPPSLMEEVLAEVQERGPLSAPQLEDRGKVRPIDWSGWKGTSRASTMALEVLWARAQVVVCGRQGRACVYDVPARALPQVASKEVEGFDRWAMRQRAGAAGLLRTIDGPQWSGLREARREKLHQEMIHEGELLLVQVEGSRRRYLALPEVFSLPAPELDDRMRILGPLDPLLWDRELVQHIFGFTYLWEVYKPPTQRRWGWYVCPLLHRGQFVGRLEGRAQEDHLRVDTIWPEPGQRLDEVALDQALARRAACLGLEGFTRPPL